MQRKYVLQDWQCGREKTWEISEYKSAAIRDYVEGLMFDSLIKSLGINVWNQQP